MTLIAQLSDLHIREPGRLAYGRLDTSPYLASAVVALGRLPQTPDAVLITGDLTDFGRPAEYAHLARLLAPLQAPVYLLPGNHDDAQNLRAAFPAHAHLGKQGHVQYSVALGSLQLIALDTTVPGAPHGSLDAARLAWLEQALEDAHGRPVVIAMHHPPFRTLIGHMDAIGLLEGGAALEAIVRQYPNVERLVCGHLHRPIEARFGGTFASTAPSPAHQVVLDLAPDAESRWNLEPGAFRVLAWTPESGLVSHLVPVAAAPGPFPFHDDGKLID